jgi:hypothetical protein
VFTRKGIHFSTGRTDWWSDRSWLGHEYEVGVVTVKSWKSKFMIYSSFPYNPCISGVRPSLCNPSHERNPIYMLRYSLKTWNITRTSDDDIYIQKQYTTIKFRSHFQGQWSSIHIGNVIQILMYDDVLNFSRPTTKWKRRLAKTADLHCVLCRRAELSG